MRCIRKYCCALFYALTRSDLAIISITFVSVCIANNPFSRLFVGVLQCKKSSFLASYRLCSKLLNRTPKSCVFPYCSSIRILRSEDILLGQLKFQCDIYGIVHIVLLVAAQSSQSPSHMAPAPQIISTP